jgi:peptidoglycan/xylan/chitin deacetylase (PgdA/CDA1 family)
MRSVDSLARVGVKVAALPIGIVKRRRAGDVVVLCYHRVGSGGREIDIPRAQFDDQVAALAASGTVLTMEEALAGSRGGVVLTVDDGFRDFHDAVLPVLERHRVPALLYLATGFVDRGDPRTGVGPEEALTWSMLEEAVSTGLVDVGSHTHRHVDLARVSEREAEDELHRSKQLVEDRLSRPCLHFAPPWGRTSPAAERVARRLFASSAPHGWRTNRTGRFDPFRLGRTPVLRNDSGFLFRMKARGLLDAERHAYRLLRRGPWAPAETFEAARPAPRIEETT